MKRLPVIPHPLALLKRCVKRRAMYAQAGAEAVQVTCVSGGAVEAVRSAGRPDPLAAPSPLFLLTARVLAMNLCCACACLCCARCRCWRCCACWLVCRAAPCVDHTREPAQAEAAGERSRGRARTWTASCTTPLKPRYSTSARHVLEAYTANTVSAGMSVRGAWAALSAAPGGSAAVHRG